MTTGAELSTLLTTYLHNDVSLSAADKLLYLNLGQKRIVRDAPTVLRKKLATLSISVAGDREYSLASDFYMMAGVWIKSVGIKLFPMGQSEFIDDVERMPTIASSYPTGYIILGYDESQDTPAWRIRFNKTPDGDYTVYYWYYYFPPVITAGSTPVISSIGYDELLLWASAMIALQPKDPEGFKLAAANYVANLESFSSYIPVSPDYTPVLREETNYRSMQRVQVISGYDLSTALADSSDTTLGDGMIGYKASGTGAVARTVHSRFTDFAVSVKDYGATGDGTTDDTAAIQAAFVASNGYGIYFPSGTYIIDNSGGALTVSSWTGTVTAESGTTLKFIDLTQRGIQFDDAVGLTIRGLSFTQKDAWVVRNSAHLLVIEGGTRITLDDLYFTNSPSCAVLITKAEYVNVSNIKMEDIAANGVFVTNCRYVNINGVNGTQVQDALIETSHYDSVSVDACRYISISNVVGYEVFTGILINGCEDVNVTGCSFDSTYGSGVSIIQDTATTTTHWPERVSVSNVTIKRIGIYPDPEQVNSFAHGVYVFYHTAASNTVQVALNNIIIDEGPADGIRIGNDTADDDTNCDVVLNNITVGNVDGVAFRFTDGVNIVFSNLYCYNAGYNGLLATQNTANSFNIIGHGITIYNANISESDTRAVYFDNLGAVFIDGMSIIDDRATALSYQVTDSGAGTVAVVDIWSAIANGTFGVGSASGVYKSVIGDIYPPADNGYYLGKNDDDSPLAWKGVILKDTTNGKYYRVEVINGTITATDLTD